MGPATTASNMGISKEEALAILDDFYTKFPRVKDWIDENEQSARKYGYVEDYWGRRRRLPDATLPDYTFEYTNEEFNPLLHVEESHKEVDAATKNDFLERLHNVKWGKQKEAIKNEALSKGIKIHDNGGFISRSMRQATNARIQGSAATMTKKAMINIFNDEELASYGFKMLIGVHDELIGECKQEFAHEAGERLAYLMRSCVPEVPVPFRCDAEIENEDYSFRSRWYGNEYAHNIIDECEKLVKKDIPLDLAKKQVIANHSEMLEEELVEILNDLH